jgi:hypothetical protein
MAILMEMPVVSSTKPAAPPTNGAKPAQGKEEGFREVLNEENLKQAKGSTGKDPEEKSSVEKPTEEPTEEPTEDSQPTAEQMVAGSAVISPPITPSMTETSVEGNASAPPVLPEGEEPLAAVLTAPAVKPAAAPEVETDQKGIQEQQPQTQLISGEKAVLEGGSKTVRQDSGENPPVFKGKIQPEKPAVSVISATAAQQPAPLQPKPEPDGQTDLKAGPQGLMEASFAGLLKPVDPGNPAVRRNPASAAQAEISGVQAGEEADSVLSATRGTVIDEADSNLAEALLDKTAGSSVSEPVGSLTEHRGETPLFDNILASAAQGKPDTTGNAGPLSVDAQMPPLAANTSEEVRVLDQVLNQLPLNRMGEKNRVVIRLHPEELGEVKLDLVMEKDHIKAQLVTQTQQVQSILEKHLPRLQEALQNQGINLDQIEVSVDSGGHQGREFFDRHNQPSHQIRSFAPRQAVSEPLNLAASGNQPGVGRGGLSLRI